METVVLICHGLESGPGGRKIQMLTRAGERFGATVVVPDHRGVAPEERVADVLSLVLPEHERLILVGSSLGGYVAACVSVHLKPHGLYLLAPALYQNGLAVQEPVPYGSAVYILHGIRDDVIPSQRSERYAAKFGCRLELVDAEHRLQLPEPVIVAPLAAMLGHE